MNFSFAALLNTKGLNSSDGNSSVSGSLSSGSGLSFDSFLSAASQGSGKSGVVGSSGNSDFTRVLNNAKSLPVNTADFNKEISASDNPVDPQIVTTEIAKEIIQEFSHKYISDDPVDSADKLSENAITNGLQQVPVELDLSGIFASLDLLKSENGEALDGKEVFVELQVPSLEELKTAGDSAIIPAKLVVRDDSGSSDVIEDKGNFIINLNELVNLLKTDLSGKIQNNDRPVAPDKEISGPTSFSINDQVNRDNDNVEKNNVELSKQKISFEAKENSSILGSIINRAPKKGEEFLTDVLTELIKVYNNENTVIDHSQTIITDKVSAVENEDNRIHVIHDSLPLISLSELALQKDPSEIKIGQIETGDSNAKEASFSISSADVRENLLNILEGMMKESDSSVGMMTAAGVRSEQPVIDIEKESSSIVKFYIPVSVNVNDSKTSDENAYNAKVDTETLIQPDSGKVSDQLKSTHTVKESTVSSNTANENIITDNKLISALQEHFAETLNTDEIIKSGKQQEDIKIGFELDLTKLSQTMKSETAEPDILEKLVNAVKAIQNSDNPDPVMQSEKVLEDIKNDIKDIKLTVTTVENKNIQSRPEMQMKSIESSTVQDKKIIFSQSDNTMMIDPEKYGFQSKSMVGGSEAEIGYIKDQKPSNFNVNSIVKDQPSEPNGEKANQPVIRELDLSEKNIKVSGSKVEIIPDVVKGGSDSKTFNNIKISFDIEDVKIPENKIDKVGIPVKVETGTKVEQAVLSMSEEDFEALRISIEKETVKPAQISRDQAEIISNNPDTQKSENSFRASAKIELPVPEKDITNVEKPQVISSNKEIKINVKPGKEESMTERPVILRIPVKNNTPVISTELPAVEKTVNQGSGHTAENFQIKESQNGDGSSLKNPELTKNTGAQQNSSVFQNNTQSSTTIKGSDETIIADTAEKTFDTKDAKNSILPGQVEITLESEDNAHKTYKTQGVFVSEAPVKDVKNDKQLSSDYSSFRAGDDLNSSDRFMTQKIGEESNQNSQQNAFSSFKEGEKGQKEFNNNKNIELQGEKAVSAEKPFEARLSDAGSPKAEHVVKVWDIEKLANQITKMAKFSVNKEQSEMKIQLEPKHLGKMFMKISVEDHQLNGSVRVETHEAKAMIQDNLPQLRESIADKGVDLQKLDVFVQSDQQHQLDQSPWAESDRFGSQKTGNSNSGPGKDEELSADEMVDTNKIREFGYNTIELVA